MTFTNCCFASREELLQFAAANENLFPPKFEVKRVLRGGDQPFFAAFTDDAAWVVEHKKHAWEWMPLVDGKVRACVVVFVGGKMSKLSVGPTLMEVA
jgi:hypothetical protein